MMITATDRPAMTSVLNALFKILQWKFYFLKRISVNVDVPKAKITKVKAFGLKATAAHLVLTIMANVEATVEHDYGCALRTFLETICTSSKYNYKRDTTSLKQVLDLLAMAVAASGIRSH